MKPLAHICALLGVLSLLGGCDGTPPTMDSEFIGHGNKPTFLSGPLEQYQPVTLTFNGPMLMENGPVNPFTDYRMTVCFTKGKRTIEVPGYFAADGNAAQTGATSGHVWRCHFLPDEPGEWKYQAQFLWGVGVATDECIKGQGVMFNEAKGTLCIKPASGMAPGFYNTGPLRYVGGRYLQLASGAIFLKNGAASPRNFLSYAHFDGMEPVGDQFTHRYEPHVKDWVDEQVTWQDGKGKGIIGALNYLASQRVTCLSFATYNIDLAGKDVSVWDSPGDMMHFDISRLAQWELVFTHMDQLGIAMHVVLNDAANNSKISRGRLGVERKLYYRELVARFAHHPAIIWDLGDEDISPQVKDEYARYIRRLDPYKHPIVARATVPADVKVFGPLLGEQQFTGASLTMSAADTHKQTLMWVEKSAMASQPWFVTWDGVANGGAGEPIDALLVAHDQNRMGLWGNLLAGGSGSECYFGTKTPVNSDRTCEDFRTRANIWRQGGIALEIMKSVPFPKMQPADSLVTSGQCLAGCDTFMVYLDRGQSSQLTVPAGQYEITWYNPRTGQATQVVDKVSLPPAAATPKATQPGKTPPMHTMGVPTQKINLGAPPKEPGLDWVVVVRVRP